MGMLLRDSLYEETTLPLHALWIQVLHYYYYYYYYALQHRWWKQEVMNDKKKRSEVHRLC